MSRTAAIHQPNFFPWLGYFYKMARSDVFILLDTVDITLGGAKAITHRARVKAANGPVWLAIPLVKDGSRQIKDIKMDHGTQWQEKHLRTLYFAYKKAPFFDDIYPHIEELYQQKPEFLFDFTTASIQLVKDYLNISTPIIKASELDVETTDRNERILELCRAVEADSYLSGFGGRKYHDENSFKKNGLELQYTDFQHPVYEQLHGGFLEGLSVIDALMQKGKETRKMLKGESYIN